MRKLFIFPVIISMILLMVGCGADLDSSFDDPGLNISNLSDVYYVNGEKVEINTDGDVFLSTEGSVALILGFSLSEEVYDFLYDNLDDVRLTGYYAEFDTGTPLTEENGKFAEVLTLPRDEEGCNFGVCISGVPSSEYVTEYIALLSLSFTGPDGEEYTVRATSGEKCVYDVALYEFCDRSEDFSDRYCYSAGDGTFSPYEDLNTHRMILYSTLRLSLYENGISDLTRGEYYESPYTVTWFDGLLTVKLASGNDLPEGLLKHIYINGKNTYFQVHEGIIRVVVDP